MTPNIADIIRQHVSLSVRCLDRVYLHGYRPKLQTSGGLCYFLHDHLGNPIPSPALFRPIHDRFVAAVDAFAARHAIPRVEFESGQDKDAIVAGYRTRVTPREGVVILGVAQEKMRSFKAHKRCGPGKAVTFDFSRQSVSVNHSYFSVQDRDWGPAFLKIGTDLPDPVKLCLNGHEWVNSASAVIASPLRAHRRSRPTRLGTPRRRPTRHGPAPGDHRLHTSAVRSP
jgi:hypothetical protein